MTGTDVVSLLEGDYEQGLGALVNSLVRTGFTGTVWAGHRGPAPGWAASHPKPAPGVEVVFVPVHTDRHLTNHKPRFLAEVFDRSDAERLAYFDPDIVVRQPWPFFPGWIGQGIAVGADVNPVFPATHPVRRAWVDLAADLGDKIVLPPIDLYVNAGFVGLHRERTAFLDDWERYLVAMARADGGPGLVLGPGDPGFGATGRTTPFLLPDQDALNLAVMAYAEQVSLMGPQAMALGPGWSVMSHAIGGPKPWRKRFLRSALRGDPPRLADWDWVRHSDGPIPVASPARRRRALAALHLARAAAALLPRRD